MSKGSVITIDLTRKRKRPSTIVILLSDDTDDEKTVPLEDDLSSEESGPVVQVKKKARLHDPKSTQCPVCYEEKVTACHYTCCNNDICLACYRGIYKQKKEDRCSFCRQFLGANTLTIDDITLCCVVGLNDGVNLPFNVFSPMPCVKETVMTHMKRWLPTIEASHFALQTGNDTAALLLDTALEEGDLLYLEQICQCVGGSCVPSLK
jgi:hypothetical protein